MHRYLLHLGPLAISVYSVVAAVGLVLAMMLAERNARRLKLDGDAVWNVCLTAIVGTLLISRIALVIQNPGAFLSYPLVILTLPTVTRFGMAAAVLCGVGYAIYRRLPLRPLADAIAPAAMLLSAFLHAGDFFAGEDIGVATTSWIGRTVPSLRGTGALSVIGSYPVAVYSAICALLIAAAGFWWLRRSRQPGEIAGATVVLAAAMRFCFDLVRADTVYAGPTPIGLTLAQVLLLIWMVLGAGLLLERKEIHHAV